MAIKHTTGINRNEKYAEDEKDDENNKETSNEGASEGIFLFVIEFI